MAKVRGVHVAAGGGDFFYRQRVFVEERLRACEARVLKITPRGGAVVLAKEEREVRGAERVVMREVADAHRLGEVAGKRERGGTHELRGGSRWSRDASIDTRVRAAVSAIVGGGEAAEENEDLAQHQLGALGVPEVIALVLGAGRLEEAAQLLGQKVRSERSAQRGGD